MRLGRVEVTPGFLLLLAWLNFVDSQALILLAAAGCLVHELGHMAALWLLGGCVRSIRVTAVGAEIKTDRSLSYVRELLCVLAGPAVNLLLAVILCRFSMCRTAAGVNLALASFNLLPVSRLDGGRALRCVLILLLDMERGERIAQAISALCVLSAGILGLYLAAAVGNITLAVVSLWLLAAEGGADARKWKQKGKINLKYSNLKRKV